MGRLNRASNYGDQGFWVRQEHMPYFQDKSISAVIRLGDRSDPGHKNYIAPGVPQPVRYINAPGPAVMGAPGDLLEDDGTTFERTECIVKTFGELTNEDLVGLTPDCQTVEDARRHIAEINKMAELPGDDVKVTIWRFRFLPNAVAEPEPVAADGGEGAPDGGDGDE